MRRTDPTRRRRLSAVAFSATSIVGASALFASAALASPAILTVGHAYCYYFWGKSGTGGMHLVAATPSTIAAGPSNYISGVGGKPQDTVVYVDCVGASAGDAYVGIPRVALRLVGGHYAFSEHVVAHNIKRLNTHNARLLTVSVWLSGTVTTGSSATGAIKGSLRVSAPACLAKPLALNFTGV